MASTSLGRCAGRFFAEGLLLQSCPPESAPSLDEARSRLLSLLDRFNKDPGLQQVAPEDVEQARFAMVAWADEMVGTSQLPGREHWNSQLLQLELYRINRAGNEFYERLASLRSDQVEAREIFFLCLALGFQGQYAGHEGDRQAILREQFAMLRTAGRISDSTTTLPLSTPAYDLEIDRRHVNQTGLGAIVMRWGAGALVVFGLMWAVLFWLAHSVPPPGV